MIIYHFFDPDLSIYRKIGDCRIKEIWFWNRAWTPIIEAVVFLLFYSFLGANSLVPIAFKSFLTHSFNFSTFTLTLLLMSLKIGEAGVGSWKLLSLGEHFAREDRGLEKTMNFWLCIFIMSDTRLDCVYTL